MPHQALQLGDKEAIDQHSCLRHRNKIGLWKRGTLYDDISKPRPFELLNDGLIAEGRFIELRTDAGQGFFFAEPVETSGACVVRGVVGALESSISKLS